MERYKARDLHSGSVDVGVAGFECFEDGTLLSIGVLPRAKSDGS